MRFLTLLAVVAGVILTSYSYKGPLGTLTAKKLERSLMEVPTVPQPGRTGMSSLVRSRESDWNERTRASCSLGRRRASISVAWFGSVNTLGYCWAGAKRQEHKLGILPLFRRRATDEITDRLTLLVHDLLQSHLSRVHHGRRLHVRLYRLRARADRRDHRLEIHHDRPRVHVLHHRLYNSLVHHHHRLLRRALCLRLCMTCYCK